MPMPKSRPKHPKAIPAFRSEDEEREFWATAVQPFLVGNGLRKFEQEAEVERRLLRPFRNGAFCWQRIKGRVALNG